MGFSFEGGLFIFTIRADSFDPKELGYSPKFEELEKSGKWSLVNRERRELYSDPVFERYCLVSNREGLGTSL